MNIQSKKLYLSLVILVAVLWGSAYPIVRFLVSSGVDPYLIVGMRIFLTFLFSAASLLASGQNLHFPLYKKYFFPFFLMSLSGTIGFSFFMTFGLQFSTASKSSIVIGSNPILVVLFSYLFLREPLGKRKFFGLCLALSGVFLAVSGADFLSGLRLHFSLNDSILVLGAVLWAAYTLLSRQYSHKLPYLEGLFWIFGLGALFSLPLLLPRIPLLLELSGLQWFWLLFCGLVPGGISYFLWNRCLSVLGASTCSICASFMPVSSGILAVLFLGEPLLWTQIIGLILVIAGVLLGLYRNKLPINYETDVSLSAREKAD